MLAISRTGNPGIVFLERFGPRVDSACANEGYRHVRSCQSNIRARHGRAQNFGRFRGGRGEERYVILFLRKAASQCQLLRASQTNFYWVVCFQQGENANLLASDNSGSPMGLRPPPATTDGHASLKTTKRVTPRRTPCSMVPSSLGVPSVVSLSPRTDSDNSICLVTHSFKTHPNPNPHILGRTVAPRLHHFKQLQELQLASPEPET